MKVYTEAEIDRLYRETLSYEQIETNTRGFDIVETFKSQWDEGQYYCTYLSPGIGLEVIDRQTLLDRNSKVEHAERQYFTAKFYLSGNHNVICPGIRGVATEYSETKGQNYLFYLPDIEEIEQYWAGDRWQMLKILVDFDTIRRFITEASTLPQQLRASIDKPNPQRFHFTVGKIISQMNTTIRQICQHPYQGAIARMYLEGKILELIAMQLSQLSTNLERQTTLFQLDSGEIDRIHDARKILLDDLDNPPSIKTLAHAVGIGERRLQKGFKELFGITVFKYLHDYRLEQAKIMLREGKFSVTGVANNIGYTHLGNFAAAFKRKFGITPRECLQGKKTLSG